MNSPLHPLKRSLLPPDLLEGFEKGGKLEVHLPGVGLSDITLSMLLFMDIDTIKLLVHHYQQEPRSFTMKGIDGREWKGLGKGNDSNNTIVTGTSSSLPLPSMLTDSSPISMTEKHPITSFFESSVSSSSSSVPGLTTTDNHQNTNNPSNPSPSTVIYHTITIPIGQMSTTDRSHVKIAGSFIQNWQEQLPLDLTPDKQAFTITLGFTDQIVASSSSSVIPSSYLYHASPGTELHFKFIVDTHWHCNHDQTDRYPIMTDQDGHHNHLLRV